MQNKHEMLDRQQKEVVSKTIVESWMRSETYDVCPNLAHAPLVYSSTHLNQLEKSHLLKQSFNHVYKKLEKEISEKYALAIADEDGKILSVRMKGKLYEQLGGVNFYPGGHWHEKVTGTNAIGTAIAAKQRVIINTADHYCAAWQSFSCAGVPIWHPINGRLIGALDLTCSAEHFPQNSSMITTAIAKGIQTDMFRRIQVRHLYLEKKYLEQLPYIQNDCLLLIDDQGKLINQNNESATFDYTWKEAYDWLAFYNQFEDKQTDQWIESTLDCFEEKPVGKVYPITFEGQVIGKIVHLPKKQVSHVRIFQMEKVNKQIEGAIGTSQSFVTLLQKVEKVAQSEVTVLLTGESGTGKEVISQAIHRASSMREQTFLTYNCASLNHDLAASELFGYAPGSFTGGLKEGKKGLFEQANGGTLFLDEIGELPVSVQAMLLRVLQEREVIRIGEYEPRKVNVRIIAATNRDLEQMVREGTFRQDLYYRLSIVKLLIPPLRERKEDILLLSEYFIKQLSQGQDIRLSRETQSLFHKYSWPGNVRELKNAIKHALVFVDGHWIEPNHLPDHIQNQSAQSAQPSFIQPNGEQERIVQALKFTRYNLTKAAKKLGISRGTLYNRLRKYRIPYRA